MSCTHGGLVIAASRASTACSPVKPLPLPPPFVTYPVPENGDKCLRICLRVLTSFQEERILSVSHTPIARTPIKNFFMTLITTFYHPEIALSHNKNKRNPEPEIQSCPVSDANLDAMIDGFDTAEQKIIYAVQCQFNSGEEPRYCRQLVEFVFGYVEAWENELYRRGVRKSLKALRPHEHTVATLQLNDLGASLKTTKAVEQRDREREEEIETLMQAVDSVAVSNYELCWT